MSVSRIFEPECHLIRIEALGPSAELSTLKLLDQIPETEDLVVPGLDRSRHVAHQIVQKTDIAGQVLEIEMHKRF